MKKALRSLYLISGAFILLVQCSPNNQLQEEFPEKGLSPLPFIDGSSYKNTQIHTPGTTAKTKSAKSINLEAIKSLLRKAKDQKGSDFVAVFSVQDESENWYAYDVQELKFSNEAEIDAQGKLQVYFFEVEDTEGNIERIVTAYIPKSALARKEMDNWIIPKPTGEVVHINSKNSASYNESSSTEMCFIEESRYGYIDDEGNLYIISVGRYEPCTTVTPPPSGDGDGGGEQDEGPDWSWPDVFDDPCPENCGGGDDNTSPDETEPCETGDPNIDNEATEKALKEMWDKSNPDEQDEFNRIEQGGWILKDPISQQMVFQEFPSSWVRTPCAIVFPQNIVIPSDAVGMLHTHPFTRNEKMYSCLGVSKVLIQQFPNTFNQVVKKYNNQPSPNDIDIIKGFKNAGIDIDGYIIDKQGIIKYDETAKQNDPSTFDKKGRCAY